MDYRFEVYPLSEEDGGGFIARAPDLPGCMADGETPEEAMNELKGAIKEWLFAANEMNREIPKPQKYIDESEYSGRLVLRMPKSTHKIVAESSEKDGCSINSFINDCITYRIAHQQGKREARISEKIIINVEVKGTSSKKN